MTDLFALVGVAKSTAEWIHRLVTEGREDMTPEEREAYETDLESKFQDSLQRIRDARNP